MYDRHLDTFIKTADLGSFAKAAQELYISPNAVIKQMNLLENDLGVRLFERTNRGVILTDAGKIIYSYAKKIIRISEEAVAKARHTNDLNSGTLRIGTSIMRPCNDFIEKWTRLTNDNSAVHFEIVPLIDTPKEWRNTLARLGEEVDLLVCTYPSTRWNGLCNVLHLTDLPICCAVSGKNPLSKKEQLTVQDLFDETVLMIHRGDTTYIDLLRDELEQYPQITIRDVDYYDTTVFNQCQASGQIMITVYNWKDIHPSLVTIPCDWKYTIPYGIIYAKYPAHEVSQFLKQYGKILKELY